MARHTNGWIKVYRALLETDIAMNPNRLSVFVHLMGMANREDTWVQWGAKPRLCPRGSLVTSLRELSKKTGADKGSVERQLRYLALRDTIVVETETRGTFITIKNYSEYQDNPFETVTDERQEADTGTDTPADATRDSNEEYNNKELKNKEIHVRIEKIYFDHYPKKEGKKKGVEAAARVLKTDDDIAKFEKAVLRYKAHLIKNQTQAKYVKQFSTFVNSWTDWADENAGSTDIKAGMHANERNTDHDAEIAGLFEEGA